MRVGIRHLHREGFEYTVSIRFTTYFLEVFENIWDKIWRNCQEYLFLK